MRAFILNADAIETTTSLARVREAHAAEHVLWVDLGAPSDDAQVVLTDVLRIHPLAVEDVWADREMPKVEKFDDFLQIIVHSVHRGASVAKLELFELDILLGANFVVTHARDPKLLEAVAGDAARTARLLKRGPAWLVHALLDRVVDDYLPLVDELDLRIHDVERDVIDKGSTPASRTAVRRIFTLKRTVQHLRRIGVRQREILLRLSRQEFEQISLQMAPFYRDVYDHFARIAELVDSYRELLSGVLEVHLSVQSNKMNEVMKTLTLISTVMLPLTFIAGVYGMNFHHMPELGWRYGYAFALLLMGVVALGIVRFFRHRKWL